LLIISGPCHAEEIALERLSYLTISSKNTDDANYLAQRLSCHYVNTKVTNDIYGTESEKIKEITNFFKVFNPLNGIWKKQ
jgi:glycerol-3-phosphate dehydrogenase